MLMTNYAFDTDIVKFSDSYNDYDFSNDHDNKEINICS